MNTKTILAATFAFAAFATPFFAMAAPAEGIADVSVAVVHTADLNLASEAGQSELKARIAGAVSRVCGTATSTINLEERLAINACRAKARTAALAAAKSREDQVLAQR